jgi:4-amino-4-deoxy-L-arabinose transferase-like glycosyltransferase
MEYYQRHQNSINAIWKIALFCTVVYFPFFLHLDALPIRIWDESRLAVNAYEMSKNGNYLVTYFGGLPDMWSTKPPLMIWMQQFFIKQFGVGELAVRLPSAIAGFLTALTLMLFSIRYLKSYWFGLIAVLVLITSYGYINQHTCRTGDYDALLTLFITVYALSFFLYCESEKRKYLHLFFIGLTLAVFTKSVQALLILPALAVYSVYTKQIKIFKEKAFYIDLFICILFISGYYMLRNHYNPGYLTAVWENELGGRYLNTIGNHKHPFLFYYSMLVHEHFAWYYLIPCGIATGFFFKEERIKKIIVFVVLCAVIYWLIISSAQTKLYWYEMPLFPFLSLITAAFLFYVFNALKNSTELLKQVSWNGAPYILVFIIFLHPYEQIIDKVYCPKEYDWDKEYYSLSHYLQDAVKSDKPIINQVVCNEGYSPHLLFYMDILNDRRQSIRFKHWSDLKSGELVVVSQRSMQDSIENHYNVQFEKCFQYVKKYRIQGWKTMNYLPQ